MMAYRLNARDVQKVLVYPHVSAFKSDNDLFTVTLIGCWTGPSLSDDYIVSDSDLETYFDEPYHTMYTTPEYWDEIKTFAIGAVQMNFDPDDGI